MKLIPLNEGLFAKVDDCDFEFLSQWKWYALRASGGLIYAVRRKGSGGTRMHRVINATPEGVFTDHRDGDGLNNQRHNLRNATPLQNMMNRRGKHGGTSRFKGVWFDPTPQRNQWRAAIRIDGSLKYLGRFSSEDDAGAAYAAAAIQHFGEFACSKPGVN